MRTNRLLLTVIAAALALMMQPGCGGGAKTPVAAKPDTMAPTGAVCATTLDTDAVSGIATQPDTQKPEPAKNVAPAPPKPKPETTSAAAAVPADTAPTPKSMPAAPDQPAKSAEKPKDLPKMWDYGSVGCLPCNTMKEILDPMVVEYKDRVDVRIVNVYKEPQLAAQAHIQVIPTQIFYDPAGKELFRHIGVYPRDSIEAKFRELGFPVVSGT